MPDKLIQEILLKGRTAHELESEVIEFKAEHDSIEDTLRDVVEAVLCFANGSGGTLVVGVANDETGHEALLGSRLEPELTRKRIFELTRPPLGACPKSWPLRSDRGPKLG